MLKMIYFLINVTGDNNLIQNQDHKSNVNGFSRKLPANFLKRIYNT